MSGSVPSEGVAVRVGRVITFPRPARAVIKPCPSKVAGPFPRTDAKEIRCSGVKGHDGPHYYRVEWTGE